MHLQSHAVAQSKADSIYSQITLPQKSDHDAHQIFGLGNERTYSLKNLQINSKQEDQAQKHYERLQELYRTLKRQDMLSQSPFPALSASLPECSFLQLLKQNSVMQKNQQKCKLFELYENTVKQLKNQKKYSEIYCVQSELGQFLGFQKAETLEQVRLTQSEPIAVQLMELRVDQQKRLKEKLRQKIIVPQISSIDMQLIILCKQYNRKRKEVLQKVAIKSKRLLQWKQDAISDQRMKELSKQLRQLKKNKKLKSL